MYVKIYQIKEGKYMLESKNDRYRSEKDVILMCKGHFDIEKHGTLEEAFIAYYHKYYGCEDYIPDSRFLLGLFLKPAVMYILDTIGDSFTRERFVKEILNTGVEINDIDSNLENEDFYSRLYNRVVGFIKYQRVKDDKGNILLDLGSGEDVI